jgi:hypothetical protein
MKKHKIFENFQYLDEKIKFQKLLRNHHSFKRDLNSQESKSQIK